MCRCQHEVSGMKFVLVPGALLGALLAGPALAADLVVSGAGVLSGQGGARRAPGGFPGPASISAAMPAMPGAAARMPQISMA